MTDTVFDPKHAVFTPAQVSAYAMETIRQSRDSKDNGIGVSIPISKEFVDYMPPVRAGEVCSIVAQTSNFKTGMMQWIANQHGALINSQGLDDQILIYVSVEETVEEQAYISLAQGTGEDAGWIARGDIQDWDRLEQAAIRIGNIPIYRIGSSMVRSELWPDLYMSNMIRAISSLVNGDILDWRPKVAGMFFDYLQAFPIDPEIRGGARYEQQRRLQVRSDFYRLRQAAQHFKCPVFVGIQAKQDMKGSAPPIMLPGVYDGEESSAIAQRTDRGISLWMPKNTHPVGTVISKKNFSFVVAENQLLVKVTKQRGRLPSGKTWMCEIDYNTNDITAQTMTFLSGRSDDVTDNYDHYQDRIP